MTDREILLELIRIVKLLIDLKDPSYGALAPLEEAARTVIQNGWPLREVRLESATLEEFFIQVTANQAVAKLEGATV